MNETIDRVLTEFSAKRGHVVALNDGEQRAALVAELVTALTPAEEKKEEQPPAE